MNNKNTALLIQLSKYPHVTELAIDCHLEIEAPKNQGLQVIIEDINLRRNPLDNECDDYVWVSLILMPLPHHHPLSMFIIIVVAHSQLLHSFKLIALTVW